MFARSSLRGGFATAVIGISFLFLLRPDPAAARRPAAAAGPPRTAAVITGGRADASKVVQDTFLVMGPLGSGAPHAGGFQDAGGAADWQGWTPVDLTDIPNYWHADTYRVLSGTYSAWCGADIPACDVTDSAGGYVNDMNCVLEWRGAVADAGQPCTVAVTALANYDVEPGYDYVSLEVETAGGIVELWSSDGQADGVTLSESHIYQPGDYVGAGSDQVAVLFRVTSDFTWSDEDCNWPTAGAMQLDDVVITLDNGTGVSWGFEDGTLGPFTAPPQPRVGNFGHIWTGLEDIDPCATNYSPQVAFIDDGVVVPGTGGTPCVNWCYGPGGFVVNTTGGLAGPDFHLADALLSPVMELPADTYDTAVLDFTIYVHEQLDADSPGIFAEWQFRSAATPEDLAWARWDSDFAIIYGGPEYDRQRHVVIDGLAGHRYVQVRFTVREEGWIYGWTGVDATPAPYFDDVRLAVTNNYGPRLSTLEQYLAQDGFPEAGSYDYADPGAASVRVDMARDIAPYGSTAIIPGDSLVVDASAVRPGAVLTRHPRLYYRLAANPAFDAYRTSGLPAAGWVACDSVHNAAGVAIAGRWSADLPDTGFFFPGDVLHYYFEAQDDVGGVVQSSLLPADTTGFSRFGFSWSYDEHPYDHRFAVRALPTLSQYGSQPAWLFWYDAADGSVWDRWHRILYEACLFPGENIDVYETRAAATNCGNGLGARATVDLLSGYEGIVYTSGGLDNVNLGFGGTMEKSPDVQLLASWLDLGGRGFYGGGDGLASSLGYEGAASDFRANRLGISVVAWDIRPLIGSQYAPRVVAAPGSDIASLLASWQLLGGCPHIRTFNAVVPLTGTDRVAEFTNASGQTGGYPYAAATVRFSAAGALCAFTPFDLARVGEDPYAGTGPGPSAAARLLGGLMWTIGQSDWSGVCFSDVPGAEPVQRFAASAFPNPFNPRVRIDYTIARPGRLTVKIFDVRGRLVRTVFDDQVTTGGSLDWDGTDARGAAAASGVYFYEARMDNEVEVGKLALIR